MGDKHIKALIVDDSILFREVLSKLVQEDSAIEVVATAGDPYDARDKIIQLRPNVMTLDIEMPKMDGIHFLKKLIPQYPVPVVVVTSLPINAFEALDAGAVDFVKKPVVKGPDDLKNFAMELREKIKIASTSKVFVPKKESKEIVKQFNTIRGTTKDLIAIGASTGGPEAIIKVVKDLPENSPPVVITQHMPPKFTDMFAQRLNRLSKLEVKEAQDGDRLKPGVALVAAGDYHLRVHKDYNGYYVSSKQGEKVSGHCPSVDVLFQSVAECAKDKAIGVILTGMGADGAKGLYDMKKAGAFTIGQDMESCVVYGMPKVAFNIGAVSEQCHIDNIADLIYKNIRID
jgi:two-component system chemotaxis response regulator CheB